MSRLGQRLALLARAMRARGIGWYGLGLVLGVSCVLNPGPDLPGSAPAGGADLGSGARNNTGATGGTGASAGAGGSTGGSGGTTPTPPGSGGTMPVGEQDAGVGADGGEVVDGAAGEGGEAGTAG